MQSVAVVGTAIQITIAQENLVDGQWYFLRLNQAIPTAPGTDTVVILNGAAGTAIELVDWRARVLLSERILPGNVCLRMVYTENSVADAPVFLVRDGIVPLP